jgi:hypothetical protein
MRYNIFAGGQYGLVALISFGAGTWTLSARSVSMTLRHRGALI